MKLSDFMLLSIDKKKFSVLHKGILVAKRLSQEYFIFLFQMDTFYVEVFCHLQHKQIQEYRAFEGTRFLGPYLEAIEINDLL